MFNCFILLFFGVYKYYFSYTFLELGIRKSITKRLLLKVKTYPPFPPCSHTQAFSEAFTKKHLSETTF